MKRTRILAAALLVAAAHHSPLSAAAVAGTPDDSGSASTAVVKGRVVGADGAVLPGAAIVLSTNESGTVSDINGYYTLAGLTPGRHTIRVSYVGYEPREYTVNVSSDQTSELDIMLSEGTLLEEANIVGALHGQRKALSVQKNNMGITNVVSADQVGKFPDANIGDALKRINGINVQYDQGEARFGQVRGTSPDLSSVTVNGNRLPSAEGDVRQVQLDLIPADMIQTIEVNKVVTSDMDGDAIGGSINLVTKNSPYRRVFNATVGSGYNWISEKMQLNLGLTYGDRFFNDKLGVLASASYQRSPSGSDNTEFGYDVSGDEVVLDNAQIRQYYVTRERQSYSLAFDYDFNPNHRLFFKSIYNRRNDWENRYRLTYKDVYKGDGGMTARVQTKGGVPDNHNARLELQQTMDFSLGGEHQLGNLKMDWDASYARATEDRPHERYFDIQLKKQTFDFNDIFDRQPWTTAVVDPNDGGKWSVKELSESDRHIAENDWKARVDFELPLLRGDFANSLKFGAKYSHKTKSRETNCYDYTDWYDGVYGDAYLQNLVTQVRDGFMPGDAYQKCDFVSREYLGDIALNSADGVYDMESASSNYDAKEGVTAVFARLDQKLGQYMQLTAGLRLEATQLKYSGLLWNVNEDTGDETLTPTERVKNNYVNVLPSILWKYDPTDQWKVRASFTETLSRPKYSYLIPSVGLDSKSDARTKVAIGNPDLKPATSFNVDLAAEYYFKDLGIVSAGVFYKRIRDFVVNEVTYGTYSNIADCEITKPVNGFDGNLFGIELGLQHDLSFIAPALKCLGVYGNYTFTTTSVSSCSVGSKDEQILPGSPKHMANASLNFDKWGFTARLSYNYTAAFQDDEAYQADPRLRRYYDKTQYLDINVGYTFGTKFKTTIYAEGNNLLNQPLRYYIGGNPDCTTQVEYYGAKLNFGIKLSL